MLKIPGHKLKLKLNKNNKQNNKLIKINLCPLWFPHLLRNSCNNCKYSMKNNNNKYNSSSNKIFFNKHNIQIKVIEYIRLITV